MLLRRLDLRRPGRPFYKRAQLACADLAHAEVVRFRDLDRLTLFADNLVPHVLRVDGLLAYDEGLLARIESEELLEHDSAEEVEIRASRSRRSNGSFGLGPS